MWFLEKCGCDACTIYSVRIFYIHLDIWTNQMFGDIIASVGFDSDYSITGVYAEANGNCRSVCLFMYWKGMNVTG